MQKLTRHSPGWSVVAALATAGLTASFMFTLVVPLQAELPVLLNADREDTSWVVTITLLVAAVTTPIAGRLGDMYGKRRVVFVLLGLLIVGSSVAALSGSIVGVLIGRGLQGVTTGVIPLGIAIMRDVLPPAKLGTSIAFMSATMGIGGAIGLPFAAYIAENADWHTLFWVAAGLGALSIAIIALTVPADSLTAGGRLDWIGAIGLGAGLTGILLYVSRGADWGWGSPLALSCLGAGIVILVLWGFMELRISEPLVDLRVAVRPAVLLTNLAAIGTGFALFASNVTFPQMLGLPAASGAGFGLSLVDAAIMVMPAGIVMMLFSPVAGWLERLFGSRKLLTLGTAIIVVSYAFVLIWSSEIWHIAVANAAIGGGIAFAYAAMPMIIMESVPANETGVSNGLNSLFRSVGTSSAAAVMGGVLASQSVEFGGQLVPTAEAFAACFWIAIIAGAVATVITLMIPKKPVAQPHPSIPHEVAEPQRRG